MRSRQQGGLHGNAAARSDDRRALEPGKRTLTMAAGPVQLQSDARGAPAVPPPAARTPVGVHKKTEFGDYWIVLDGTSPADARIGQQGEVIELTRFTAVEHAWNNLQAGGGKLLIVETDTKGHAHGGFRATTLARLGMLMTRPKGRELVVDLVTGAKTCTIRPAPGEVSAGAQTDPVHGFDLGPGTMANGKNGPGDDSVVNVDVNWTDDRSRVYDAAGKLIANPVYIILGHELIHARHLAAGAIDMSGRADEAKAREEEITISTGTLTENDLRAEHGLAGRHGHRAAYKTP